MAADGGKGKIKGAKGGSSSSRTPVEAPDSLNSIATANILDLLGEGELAGWYSDNALKDIFLDETPIMNSDGSMNFTNVQVDWREGTQDQSFIPGFPAVENELAVGVELKQSASWTHAINNPALTAFRVRLSVAALSKTNTSNGDITGYSVVYAIDLATDGGAYVTVLNNAFTGKTNSKYERTHRIDLPPATTGWQIRVRRLTADTEDANYQDTTAVESYTEIMDVKLRYPNSALVGIKIDASQFRNIPSRAFRKLGRIMRVPSNYDPVFKTYTGVWDGTFQLAWTNNPAWIFYDLVTNTRFGLGKLVDETQIDKWSLYKIGQYCDGLVPAGKTKRATISTGSTSLSISSTGVITRTAGDFVAEGFLIGDSVTLSGFSATNNGDAIVKAVTATTMTVVRPTGIAFATQAAAAGRTAALRDPMEPRFTCTVYLQRQEEAYKVLQDIASVFRGISYWGNGAIIPVGDMPRDPVYTYTNGNVKDGKFSYQGSSRRARHTVALVSWSDPNDFNRQKVEYVPDPEGIARYGIQETQVTAVGCTSQGQAQRVGKWILLTERYETDTVTFAVGLDGALALPGQIIRVADAKRAGRRTGGRVASATANVITVDFLPVVAIGDDLTCILPTGVAQTRPVSAIVGSAITVSPAYDAAPVAESVWTVESPTLKNALYSVISIGEGQGLTAVITALQHEPDKFDAVELGTKIEPAQTTSIASPVQAPPTNVIVTATPRAGQVIANTLVTAKWTKAANAVSYDVQWRRDDGEWSSPQRVLGNNAELYNAFPGAYVCKVSARNALNIQSIPAVSETYVVDDQLLKPGFVEALETDIAQALLDAENAQATADGAIVSFWQTTAPVIGSGAGQAKVGDIWFDTDDGNRIWRVVGGVWVDAQDDALAQALAAASTAQATADGKVKTYFQSAAPSSGLALGDLWFDTDDKKLYRWTGSAWSQNIADITLDQLAGNGHNVLWDEHARFPASPLPTALANAGAPTPTWNAAHAVGTGGSLQTVTATTSTSEGYYLADTTTDYHMPLAPGKYIFSAYVMSSVAGHNVRLGLRRNNDGVTSGGLADVAIVNANTWERISIPFDFSAQTTLTAVLPFLYTNRSGVAGRTVKFDGLMLEHQIGTQVYPSAWTPGKSGRMAINAIAAAAAALDVADGKIETYFQASMPAGTLGDLWFDTDDGNKVWRHNGTTFVEIQDDAIAQAIANAAGAQATADGRVTTFYASSAPTPNALGDLWYNTTAKDLSRWNGSTWVKIGDITADKLAGSGANVLWEEYSQLSQAQSLTASTNPAVQPSGVTLAAVADAAAFGGFSYQATTTSTATTAYARFAIDGTDNNINIGGNRKYLVSYYAKANVAGHQVRPFVRGAVANTDGTTVALTTTRTRYTWVWDASAVTDAAHHFGLFCNTSGVSGRIVTFDGFMVEPMLGNDTTPSQFVPGPSIRQTARAIANAALAQATADGKIDSYYQAAAPGSASEGDLWFDTDDGNKIYTRRSGVWVATPDSGIAAAISAAAGAQSTADGKVKTFYQTATPTAEGTGDLWFHTTTKELKRWSGSAWVTNGTTVNTGALQNGGLAPGAFGPNLVPNGAWVLNTSLTPENTVLVQGDPITDGWYCGLIGARTLHHLETGVGVNNPRIRLDNVSYPVTGASYTDSWFGTKNAIDVLQNRTYKFSYKGSVSTNVTKPGTFNWIVRPQLAWYDSTDTLITSIYTDITDVYGNFDVDVNRVAPAGAVRARIFFHLYHRNNGAAAYNPAGLIADFRMFTVSLMLLNDLDTEVADGTDYGRYSVLDRFSSGGFWRLGLRIGNSGHRIGNQRNLTRSNTSAYGMVRTTTALTANSSGQVTVNAHTVRYGGYSVAYNAVTNAVTGLTVGSSYVIYCSDPDLTGGTKTYFATTNPDAAMNISDDIYVVGQITIPSSGSSSGGGGGGGTDPGDWCVDYDTLLPDGRYLRDLCLGEEVECIDVVTGERGMFPLLGMRFGEEDCYRLVTPELASVIQSKSTPMDLPNGKTETTSGMFGKPVYIHLDNEVSLSFISDLQYLGLRRVIKPDFGNRMFFAGESARATIATHNAIHKP